MRQRVAVEPAGDSRGSVTRRHGVACSAAARLRRRAGVSSTSLITPITSARLCERKPSSIAHKASLARAVSTNSQSEGAKPKAARPPPYGAPNSRANCDDQHHNTGAEADCAPARHSRRRAVSRNAKPRAAAQSPAVAPVPRGTVFTSCNEAGSRPPPNRRSNSRTPKVQPPRVCGSSTACSSGAPRSIVRMLARNRASTSCLPPSAGRSDPGIPEMPPSGTARRDSPFRFGQELLGPTPRNSLREHALGPGSDRETQGRQPDGGVGDEAG